MIRLDITTGATSTIGSFILGMIPTFTHETKDEIVFFFQVGAFLISIIVGVLTAINICHKIKERRSINKNK